MGNGDGKTNHSQTVVESLVGGVFGRMDAAYVTIEAQKSTGSLHAHCQCFVQCLHQHTALEEIFQLGAKEVEELRNSYLTYSGHVMHGVYEGHSKEEVSRNCRSRSLVARAQERAKHAGVARISAPEGCPCRA
jgi:hypothetical protein